MGKYLLTTFIKDQYTTLPPVEHVDLSERVAVVTGSNTGLGLETARYLATMNPQRIILACRNTEKAQTAVRSIVQSTRCTRVEAWLLDQSDFKSVIAFADRFKTECGRLDIFVANAAVNILSYEETVDGWETQLQVSYLSACLLALLLLPCLASAGKFNLSSRIVFVTSDMHYWIKLADIENQEAHLLATLSSRDYCTQERMSVRYQVAKFLGVMFMREFSSHLAPETPVLVTTGNPGFCHSELNRNLPARARVPEKIFKLLLARKTEVGSRLIVYASVGESSNEAVLRGSYTSPVLGVKEPSDEIISDKGSAASKRVWDETISVLQQVDPTIKDIVEQYLGN